MLLGLSDTHRDGYKRIMEIWSKERLERSGQADPMHFADKALKQPDLPNAAEFSTSTLPFPMPKAMPR